MESIPQQYACLAVKSSLLQKRSNMMARTLQNEIKMKAASEWTKSKVKLQI